MIDVVNTLFMYKPFLYQLIPHQMSTVILSPLDICTTLRSSGHRSKYQVRSTIGNHLGLAAVIVSLSPDVMPQKQRHNDS